MGRGWHVGVMCGRMGLRNADATWAGYRDDGRGWDVDVAWMGRPCKDGAWDEAWMGLGVGRT